MKKIWICITILLLSSCGAKKKVVSKSKTVESKDIFITESDSIKSETNLSKLVENLSIEPADPTKPFETTISNGEEEITISGNNAKVLLKTETIDSTSTVKENLTVQIKDKSQIEKKEVNKNIESDGWNWRGLNWFVLLLIILFVVWIFYRFKKE